MTPASQLDISGIRILDGGLASELERRGCDISGPLWSAHVLEDNPEIIEAVHLSYLEAGADCILTASYQVSAKGYAELGNAKTKTRVGGTDTEPKTWVPQVREANLGGSQNENASTKAEEALRQSINLALSARKKYNNQSPRPIWIGASLGPYGAALHNGAEYHGNYDLSSTDLVSFHSERLAVIETTQADFVAFETIPSIEEAKAIIEALHQHPSVQGWISFTCRDAEHVAHGEKLTQCAEFLDKEKQVIAIGINCTLPKFITPLIGELKQSTSKPIVVYPNSGEGWDAEHRRWTGTSDAAEFGQLAREWPAAGAQIIGGCCRTTPDHIRAIRKALT